MRKGWTHDGGHGVLGAEHKSREREGGEAERRARAYVGAKFNAHGRAVGAGCFLWWLRRWGPAVVRVAVGEHGAGGPGASKVVWWVRSKRARALADRAAPPCREREAAAWVGVGQPGTGCPSRDRWLGSRLGSWPPPRGGGSGAGGVGSAPGPWPAP